MIVKIPIEEDQNEDRELDLELDFQLSLTTSQRFEMMFNKSMEMAKLLGMHGHGKSAQIIKRT